MRSSTENIYLQKINQVIDYIGANLDKHLHLDIIAGQINVSERQLLRIMRSSMNESLYSYIARQRLERAVMYMQMDNISLDKLAGMVGYDNPQSFSKAFKKQFGISPKAYMNELNIRLESYVKKSETIECSLQPEICYEEDLELVYIRITGVYGEKEPYDAGWSRLINFLEINDALTDECRFIGMSFDDPNVTKPEQCRFYACASVKRNINPTGEFGTIRLKHGKYAVYTLKGSYSRLQDFYNKIWFSFEFTLRHGAMFEEYLNSPHDTKEENLMTKIFIPII